MRTAPRDNTEGLAVLIVQARTISPTQIEKINQCISDNAFQILSQRQLSQQLDDSSSTAKACLEFTLESNNEADFGQLNRSLETLAEEQMLDVDLLPPGLAYQERKLAVFDMDSTLIGTEVIDELAKLAGVGEQVAAVTERAMRGELDFVSSFKHRMALLEGLDESVLQNVAEQLPINEGAANLLSTLKSLGYTTVILSGGFTYFARYLQTKLAIDEIHANELDIQDGKVTGQVVGTIVDGARKAELLQQLAEREGLQLNQTIAVGDGANDLPMLGLAGMGVAFHAKPLVRESARHSISILGLDGVLYLLGVAD